MESSESLQIKSEMKKTELVQETLARDLINPRDLSISQISH